MRSCELPEIDIDRVKSGAFFTYDDSTTLAFMRIRGATGPSTSKAVNQVPNHLIHGKLFSSYFLVNITVTVQFAVTLLTL